MKNRYCNRAFGALFLNGLCVQNYDPGGYNGGFQPAWKVEVLPQHWQEAGEAARRSNLRWAGLWVDEKTPDHFVVMVLFARQGEYVLVHTHIHDSEPQLASQANLFPSAGRMERHAADLYGICFLNQPDSRRWTRHRAWDQDVYPLRLNGAPENHGSPANPAKRTPPDSDYPFARIRGSGVHEIPVGPVHAGIIEPGHFRFHADGETVLMLEQRLGYVHKGIEKIAQGRDSFGLARLAGRVSGDSTVAFTWAACQAMERAAGCVPTRRSQQLRALMAERERVANHLGDIGAICNDVGFAFAYYQCGRLREQWQRRSQELFGHRFMMDCILPGGLGRDLAEKDQSLLKPDHDQLRAEMSTIFDVIGDHGSLDDRLIGTGCLRPEDARLFGVLGYVGKASGHDVDIRRDNPYEPYDQLNVAVSLFKDGDVAARIRVRMEEIRASLDIMDQLLQTLQADEVRVRMPLAPEGEGIGIVEGWRGEIICYVRFDGDGRIARFFPRDPSWFSWPALERLIQSNIVPDFPVCNKSVNASYSGQDL